MTKPEVQYQFWLTDPFFDTDTQMELQSIASNPREIEDRFYRELEFGTAGLRGVIGAGTNRMNRYTVRKATQGLANYMRQRGEQAMARGVAIAYDSRLYSREFAWETASVLAANGIRAFLFPHIQPTPVLSFAVRHLGAEAGVVITASHNPKEYNGYKVYSADGGQVVPSVAERIYDETMRVVDYKSIPISRSPEQAQTEGLFSWIGDDVVAAYIEKVTGLVSDPDPSDNPRDQCAILYTPLCGAGYALVPKVLAKRGFTKVALVAEQAQPDPAFPTLHTPNPEEPAALAQALSHALTVEQDRRPDIILATDADADRLGVLVRHNGSYEPLTGNQVGVILLDSVLRRRNREGTLSRQCLAIKTIVSTEMADAIAAAYGIRMINTLTGFKFIAEQIEQMGVDRAEEFVFGFEESSGFLAATFVRDKDAVMAAMLLAEEASDCKKHGITLVDRLNSLYDRFGYYQDATHTVTLPGKEGLEKIEQTMRSVRQNPIWQIGALDVNGINDYMTSIGQRRDGQTVQLDLPKSDVVEFRFTQGGYVILRPSGTEPKIKLYVCVAAPVCADAAALLNETKTAALQQFGLDS